MSHNFNEADFLNFWSSSAYADESYVGSAPTSDTIHQVEQELGYKLPQSYIELAQTQNGGIPKNTNHRMTEATSWAEDHIAISGIYSIGFDKQYSLCGEDFNSCFWIDEWQYPAIGIYFADCPSAGHDMVALDYRSCGPQGEPQVVHVDQESDYKITKIADDFSSFIRGLEHDDAFISDTEPEIERILRENDTLAVTQLIEIGFDLESTDEHDRTIMENAAIQNKPDIIRVLASSGAKLRNSLALAEQNYKFFPDHKTSVDLLTQLAGN